MKHKAFTSAFRAEYSSRKPERTSLWEDRVKQRIAHSVSKPSRPRRVDLRSHEGISLHDARLLASTPDTANSRHLAKNGCTCREIVAAAPWRQRKNG